jgi:hypothetical protein
MAKKKQLAGKKTKLAKLPLTQVLAGQAEWPTLAPLSPLSPPLPPLLPPEPPPVLQPAAAPQLSFTWEEAREGAAGPLASVYLRLVQELAALKSRLQAGATTEAGARRGSLPPQVPRQPQILGALRLARKDLLDLHRLLSSS